MLRTHGRFWWLISSEGLSDFWLSLFKDKGILPNWVFSFWRIRGSCSNEFFWPSAPSSSALSASKQGVESPPLRVRPHPNVLASLPWWFPAFFLISVELSRSKRVLHVLWAQTWHRLIGMKSRWLFVIAKWHESVISHLPASSPLNFITNPLPSVAHRRTWPGLRRAWKGGCCSYLRRQLNQKGRWRPSWSRGVRRSSLVCRSSLERVASLLSHVYLISVLLVWSNSIQWQDTAFVKESVLGHLWRKFVHWYALGISLRIFCRS